MSRQQMDHMGVPPRAGSDFAVNDPVNMRDGPTKPRKGWRVDRDWWHWRAVRTTDKFTRNDFSNSVHAFIENGKLYCRDAEQAAELDAGRVPENGC